MSKEKHVACWFNWLLSTTRRLSGWCCKSKKKLVSPAQARREMWVVWLSSAAGLYCISFTIVLFVHLLLAWWIWSQTSGLCCVQAVQKLTQCDQMQRRGTKERCVDSNKPSFLLWFHALPLKNSMLLWNNSTRWLIKWPETWPENDEAIWSLDLLVEMVVGSTSTDGVSH